MSFIKTPFSVAFWGVKVLANTAFYGLALYGAANVAVNTYSAVTYLRSLKPEKEIRQTVETRLREYAIESLKGSSIDEKLLPEQELEIETRYSGKNQAAEIKPETKYSREKNLLEELKKNPDFTRDYADWVKK